MDTKYRIEIDTPEGAMIDKQDLSEKEARTLMNNLIENSPDDTLVSMVKRVMKSFGFMGYSNKGYKVNCYAYKPREATGEKLTCPRRMFNNTEEENPDEWVRIGGNERVCSYCGSIHPMDLIDLIKELGFSFIEATTKSYKWYIHKGRVKNASLGAVKYYRHHDTEEFIQEYNKLIKKSKASQTSD